jgi:hypothetical protein
VSDNPFDESSRAPKACPGVDNNSNTSVLSWSPENQSIFAEVLLNPPEPNEALQRAFALREKLLVTGECCRSDKATAPKTQD